MRNSPLTLIQIARPGNLLITGLTVIVGGIIAAGSKFSVSLDMILAAMSAALVAAGANALNDCYDTGIDLVNRPDRAIPSGKLTRTAAAIWGWILTFSGIGLGWWIDKRLGAIAVGVGLLLWLYNSLLKRTYLLGNIAVALCGGATFIYGGIAVGKINASWIPAIFAFMIHLSREIIKDVEDIAGDSAAGARTMPIISGKRVALGSAGVALIILALLTPLPYFLQIFSVNYLLIVSLASALPLIIISVQLFRGPEDSEIRRLSNFLKIIMITGLIALYVG